MTRLRLLRPFSAALLALLLAGLAGPARAVTAASDTIAVLFPDIGEPYRKVFTEIIGGVEQQLGGKVRAIPVGAGSGAEVQSGLKRQGARTVIALGRQGLRAAGALDGSFGIVVGGIGALPEPERWRGIGLAPDPVLLFSWLKTLVPGVRRVFVVYHPVHSQAIVRLAREAARGQGLELLAIEANDLAGAVRGYHAAFAMAEGRRDALWLPQDSVTVDDTTILPMLLRESWNRAVPLFSSSILHVKKGVLFALYPDNVALGRELAALAQAAVGPEETARPGLQPLRAVRLAVNTRTASHLGLDMESHQHPFDAVFP
ncbi:ABC transporter substrate binding protein [Pseudoduganella chitinolytica]|uniref:ABC transporter substrate binding protein n=1 Tax=Pseudoduganella chitinolytica TaxID=34070 RepID=A0ABY8BEU0_9BURK|nr:ABC transporter substrate binding protein [Pseudoduganella chitinolytica]WEF34422.1 ABC transporter substrate binding protein [Pseudoduganella chitinolytica]